jgi:acyl carrier protein
MSDANGNLKQEMKELICEITELDDLGDDQEFKSLGVDSMTAIEIVSALERKYDIKVPEAELMQLTSLNAAYSLVQKKLAEHKAA